jgi:hypothetical protein
MGRPVNPKCWECSLLDSKTAKELHGEAGDGCWNEKICHRRRSHYRNRADNNQKRKSHYVSVKATRRQELRSSITIKPAAPPIALLYLYRESRKDAHLHAGGSKAERVSANPLYGHDQRPSATVSANRFAGVAPNLWH